MQPQANITQEKRSRLKRVALSLQYDGSAFCGWQRQSTGVSVQGVLERAISDLDPLSPIQAVAAGRTDSGVHAAGQVVHFDCNGQIPPNRWSSALNGRLPEEIRITESVECPSTWHACHSAIYRRYRYVIYNGCRPNIFLSKWSWHRYQYCLDEQIMSLALQGMLGYHDFEAFRRVGSNRSNSYTTIQEVFLERKGDLLIIEIQASGFLYGMVRLLVGQLVALGEHRFDLDHFERLWKECRRKDVKEAAPAKGLFFLRAGYEDCIFSKASSYTCLPNYSLSTNDPPKNPPLIVQ